MKMINEFDFVDGMTRLEYVISLLSMECDVLKTILVTKGILTEKELEDVHNDLRQSELYKEHLDKSEYAVRVMDMADSNKPLTKEDEDYIRDNNYWDDKEDVNKFIENIKMMDVFDGILRSGGDIK